MYQSLLANQYGLHLTDMQKSSVGAGSGAWFLTCEEERFVLKFPSASAINHPEAEPALCDFLRAHDIPACLFLKKSPWQLSFEGCGRAYLHGAKASLGRYAGMEHCIHRTASGIRRAARQNSSGASGLPDPSRGHRRRLFPLYDARPRTGILPSFTECCAAAGRPAIRRRAAPAHRLCETHARAGL